MSRFRAAAAAGLPSNLTDLIQESFVENDYVSIVRQAITILAGADPDFLEPLPEKVITKTLALAFEAVLAGELSDDAQDELKAHAPLPTIFLSFVYLISSASRNRVADKDVADDLRKMFFPAALVKVFMDALTGKRSELEAAAIKKRIVLPGLDKIEWRVDVAITTAHLIRAFRPTVTFQITTTDGKVHTFESSVEKFHQLRFNVARVLAAMQNIEQHPTLKRLVD